MAKSLEDKKILDELKDIKDEEKEILKREDKVEETLESTSFKEIMDAAPAVKELSTFRSKFVRRIQKHKLIFTLFVAVGIVLVWRGLWELSESIIASAAVSLVLGIVLLWLIKRYTDLH